MPASSGDDLDAFFAKCDDVLENWYPSDDAMIYKVGQGDEPEAERVDSYYSQDYNRVSFDEYLMSPFYARMAEMSFHRFADAISGYWEAVPAPVVSVGLYSGIQQACETVTIEAQPVGLVYDSDAEELPASPYRRALDQRRNRNTGPALPGMDGRRRRG